MEKIFYISSKLEVIALRSKIYLLYELYNNVGRFIEKYLDEELGLLFDLELKKTDNEEEEREIIAQSMKHMERTASESRDVLSHYIIVATFSFYEKSLKKVLKIINESSRKLTDKQITKLSNEGDAQNVIKNFNMDYYKCSDYSKVEKELRYLNNSIKHSGKVSKKLAEAISSWIENNEIENNIYNDFERLKNAPYNLLNDFLENYKHTKS